MKIDIIECNSPISVHTFARTETHVDQIPMEVEMYDPSDKSQEKALALSTHPVMRAQKLQLRAPIPKPKTSSKGKKSKIVKQGGIEQYLLTQALLVKVH